VPLVNIFGIGPIWNWCVPIDPVFPDYDAVMGYSTPQRLLREQMRAGDSPSVTSKDDTSWGAGGMNV
jgi:hypothetical protein